MFSQVLAMRISKQNRANIDLSVPVWHFHRLAYYKVHLIGQILEKTLGH
jgi:hypothetical protein